MKKILTLIAAIVGLAMPAQAGMGIGLFGGLSTPNDEMNNVYNTDNISSWGELGNMFRNGAKTGYHIGAKARIPLSSGVMLHGGIAWNRFPESCIDVTNPNTGEKIVTLETVQDIIPISAGINYYLLRSAIGLYATGELSYNINKNTVNVNYSGVQAPLNLDESPSYNRVGAGFGAGLDVDLYLFLANIEAKYNYVNLIGREDGEEMKSYFTLSLAIYFGDAACK